MEVSHTEGQAAFLATLSSFVAAVEPLDDLAMLAATRCRGWDVVDVVTHVRLGLEEVAAGLLTAGTDDPPDRDAATYWLTQPPGTSEDEMSGLLYVRRLGSATRMPTSALIPLRLVADALEIAVGRLEDGALGFQGWTLTTGDFLATWAVEVAVHQLDIACELDVAAPDRRGLTLARRTVEELVGTTLPVRDDADAVLLGTGRREPSEVERVALGTFADRLPAF